MKKQGDIRRSEEDARTSRARGWTSLSVNPWGALQHSDTAGFVYPGAQGVGFCVPGLVTYGWGPPPVGEEGSKCAVICRRDGYCPQSSPTEKDTNCPYYVSLLFWLVGLFLRFCSGPFLPLQS